MRGAKGAASRLDILERRSFHCMHAIIRQAEVRETGKVRNPSQSLNPVPSKAQRLKRRKVLDPCQRRDFCTSKSSRSSLRILS